MPEHSVTGNVARTQFFSRNGRTLTLEEITREWNCKKRDGEVVSFDLNKISNAIRKCFVSCNITNEIDYLTEKITRAVVNNLLALKLTCPEVEHIQRLVIQQLWSEGLFEAAEHYQNYREERRKARLKQPISSEQAIRVLEDQKHFPSDLQYFQYMSKFSRWREEDKRRETWRETCFERVLPWLFKQVPDKLMDYEKDELGQSMFNFEASPAMRVVQMAGPALDRCNVGAYNCGTKETKFITNSGVRTFEDYEDGDIVTVLTHNGNWQKAKIRAYGRGNVQQIHLRRGNSNQVVEFTANHTWLLEDGTRTTSLRVGDRLFRVPSPMCEWDYDNCEPDEKLYWAYGFVYGDGTLVKKGNQYKYSMVRLCADKTRFLERFLELGFSYSTPPSYDGEPVVYTGRYLKDLPSLTENGVRLTRAFVHGWLDADGCRNTNIGPNKFTSIQVTGKEAIEFIRDVFPVVGVYITGEKDKTDQVTNYGPRSDTTVAFRLLLTHGTSPNQSLMVNEIGSVRRTDLWCLEVEEDHSFVLPCGIVTGNCAYMPICDLFSFPELLYILMQGTGVGFSCESDYVSELPRIKKQKNVKKDIIVVPDSTEGWCDSFHEALQRWFDGYDCDFDVNGVRKKNSRLKTKGGRSSGPGPLIELFNFARNMIIGRSKTTGFLEDTDVHRLCCFEGRIVQVGGVRRAAELSLSDLNSRGMRDIKSGSWWSDNLFWSDGKYLSMANNSAVYEEYPEVEVFMEEMLALIKSKAGERGIFNRQGAINNRPARRKAYRFGGNPCLEILLRAHEFCNLSMAVARKNDTIETLRRKVRLATMFGCIQSTCTKFNYLRSDWKKNCEEERLLGVDITGHADCPLLQYGAPGRAELLNILKEVVHQTKVEYARRFGINESTADTCIKPGGDSAVFFDCGSGISDRFADQQIRWVREPKDTPVSQFLIDSGVPYAPAPEAPELLNVFGFPREAPEGCTTRNDHTAIQQLEMWLETKKNWAEHSVSVTVYVEPHEWPDVISWCYKKEHWDYITGIAFLPKDNGTYTYPPNEELTPEQFEIFKAKFPKLNWSKLPHYEVEDMTISTQSYACVGESCSL